MGVRCANGVWRRGIGFVVAGRDEGETLKRRNAETPKRRKKGNKATRQRGNQARETPKRGNAETRKRRNAETRERRWADRVEIRITNTNYKITFGFSSSIDPSQAIIQFVR